jgi:hypothetical protein
MANHFPDQFSELHTRLILCFRATRFNLHQEAFLFYFRCHSIIIKCALSHSFQSETVAKYTQLINVWYPSSNQLRDFAFLSVQIDNIFATILILHVRSVLSQPLYQDSFPGQKIYVQNSAYFRTVPRGCDSIHLNDIGITILPFWKKTCQRTKFKGNLWTDIIMDGQSTARGHARPLTTSNGKRATNYLARHSTSTQPLPERRFIVSTVWWQQRGSAQQVTLRRNCTYVHLFRIKGVVVLLT